MAIIEKQVNFTLEVLAPPDIFLEITPPAQAVRQGRLAYFDVAVRALNGFAGSVELTIEGIPVSTYVFSVNPVIPDGQSQLVIDTLNLPVGPPVTLILKAKATESE